MEGRDKKQLSGNCTCGVRFLRTSQLLVLVELSVLQVVPAVNEKDGSQKQKSVEREVHTSYAHLTRKSVTLAERVELIFYREKRKKHSVS